MRKKICLITGSRAEYGVLRPLLEEIRLDPDLSLKLVVTGMHLSGDFGLTYREIEGDGFRIDGKVDIGLNSDATVGIAGSMGKALPGFAKVFNKLKPDMVVVLGDRFEIFSAAVASLICRIHLGHIYGGELTEGVFDDAFRHSITKMSQLHFTSNKVYRKRVIQLGEKPDSVFEVGSLSIDAIRRTELLSRDKLEDSLGFRFKKRNLLITFHPVTLEKGASEMYFRNLLEALDRLEDTQLIFTKANADTEGRVINRMIDGYVAKSRHKSCGFVSLGHKRYISLLKFVDAVIGNSSSGLIEAPYFRIGTVNIGDRQKGRLSPPSVINCLPGVKDISEALERLYSNEFQQRIKTAPNPYGDGYAAPKIKAILKAYDFKKSLKKAFYDFPVKKDIG